ncbi:hypothetical protein JXB41_04365 [Candidatus Woesearchaeota archaeon]|nr:hypothetical protein [Candidatus Woesearchaeota archaeon]
MDKETVTKFMSDVPAELVFRTSNSEISNLRELIVHLKTQGENFFNFHVTQDKNDFANWIRDVIQDKELANGLFPIKSYNKTINFIEERINYLENYESRETLFKNLTDLSLKGELSSDYFFNMLGSKDIFTNFLNFHHHTFEDKLNHNEILKFIIGNESLQKRDELSIFENKNINELLSKEAALSTRRIISSPKHIENKELIAYLEKTNLAYEQLNSVLETKKESKKQGKQNVFLNKFNKDFFSNVKINLNVKENINRITNKFCDILYSVQKYEK